MAGTVTAVKPQARHADRLNIFVDGKFAIGVSQALAEGVEVGEFLSDEQIERLALLDAEEHALRRAIRLLDKRPRTELELRRHFNRHKVPPEIQVRVLERLRGGGLADDRAFAEVWVENRRAFRPRGVRALRAELRQKGVPGETIELALSGYDEDQAAVEAAEKAVRRLQHLPQEEFVRRLKAHLIRRGFPYETASMAVRRQWDELQARRDESEVDPWKHNG